MIRQDGRSSQAFRRDNPNFRSLGNGKFGGYKKGVVNGPEGTTERCGRRKQKRAA